MARRVLPLRVAAQVAERDAHAGESKALGGAAEQDPPPIAPPAERGLRRRHLLPSPARDGAAAERAVAQRVDAHAATGAAPTPTAAYGGTHARAAPRARRQLRAQ